MTKICGFQEKTYFLKVRWKNLLPDRQPSSSVPSPHFVLWREIQDLQAVAQGWGSVSHHYVPSLLGELATALIYYYMLVREWWLSVLSAGDGHIQNGQRSKRIQCSRFSAHFVGGNDLLKPLGVSLALTVSP